MGAEGPRQPKVYATHQPKHFSDFLFIWFILFSLCFFKEHAEKLFSIRFLDNYLDNYLKTFVQPINQKHFQIFFLFGSFFFLSVFLHLCTFKTPTCRRFMSAKVGSLCAFKMRKGVKNMQRNCFPFGFRIII
jgi:hypothetical protein